MSAWSEVERDAPEFARRVQKIFDGRRHKVIATLRRDGSPRISGIELQFVDGEATLGMMPGSLKLADVKRDPRVAIHGASDDPPPGAPHQWQGDVKVSGRLVSTGPLSGVGPPGEGFRLDIGEVVYTTVETNPDLLVIAAWHPGRGVQTSKRE
ncbi:MAG: pyridoxamine 5'-phosphate oxidase family protein [Candidatus Dormibacteria bacterium]